MLDIKKANWIWIPDWKAEDKEIARVVYFRRTVTLHEVPSEFIIHISADSRYKLYINKELVEIGPSKGDRWIWYYDTIDIAPYLKKGVNILAVIVLRYPQEHRKGNHGVFRTETPGLCFTGEYQEEDGRTIRLEADQAWKCFKETKYKIIPESTSFAPLQTLEETAGNKDSFGWMDKDFKDINWENAVVYGNFAISKAVSPGNLTARTIPFMYKTQRSFKGIAVLRQSESEEAAWNLMLEGKDRVTVKAETEKIIEINTGELMTGFLRLAVTGGEGTTIQILQSEGYVQTSNNKDSSKDLPQKADRNDMKNGYLHGFTDTYKVAGLGKRGREEVYEPFWFRTFRFIQLRIRTGKEPLTIEAFNYMETGYPLEVKTWVRTSDESLSKIWDISERTLRRCMHETYEDCPFYEQLQYAMDTRSQILYTFMVSADDRLARKCYDDFKRSQRYDGMINCSYPNYGPNIIPGFSIYYIMMLYDHMMYFGDKELIKFHMPAIDGILTYFDRNLTNEGLVAKIGGLNNKEAYLSFIDWTTQWKKTTGVPRAILKGPITMESLLYVMGLCHAAKLASFIGRNGIADEYKDRAEKVMNAIKTYCTGSNGMIQDGPGIEEYSQHCQVFAILTDTVDIETGRKNMIETINHKLDYTQCSVAMAFYLYRALEKVGLYEYTDGLWNLWRDMIRKNLTTCVEDGLEERSDCHAWGALALFELPAVILGVRPTAPGFEKIEVNPVSGYLDWAEGEVITPKGIVKVSWKKVDQRLVINYSLPE